MNSSPAPQLAKGVSLHFPQRAACRSRSLEAFGPQRIISGVNATASRCSQRSQTTQHHGWSRRSSSRVGAGGLCFMLASIDIFAPVEQPRGIVVHSVRRPYMLGPRVVASAFQQKYPLASPQVGITSMARPHAGICPRSLLSPGRAFCAHSCAMRPRLSSYPTGSERRSCKLALSVALVEGFTA